MQKFGQTGPWLWPRPVGRSARAAACAIPPWNDTVGCVTLDDEYRVLADESDQRRGGCRWKRAPGRSEG